MSKSLLLAALMASLSISRVVAQQNAPRLSLTPYAGYMKFGTIVNGPLGTSLRPAGAVVYGGELSLGLSRNIALVGNLAYAEPRLEVGVPIVGGLGVGESTVLLYDAGLRLSAPLGGRGPLLTPFVQGGVGAMRQTLTVSPISTRSTNLAYNVGVGADLQLAPRVGLQLMAKDYIGKFDAREATALDIDTRTTHNWVASAGLRIGF